MSHYCVWKYLVFWVISKNVQFILISFTTLRLKLQLRDNVLFAWDLVSGYQWHKVTVFANSINWWETVIKSHRQTCFLLQELKYCVFFSSSHADAHTARRLVKQWNHKLHGLCVHYSDSCRKVDPGSCTSTTRLRNTKQISILTCRQSWCFSLKLKVVLVSRTSLNERPHRLFRKKKTL